LLLTDTIPLGSVTLSGPTRYFYPTGNVTGSSLVTLVVIVSVSVQWLG